MESLWVNRNPLSILIKTRLLILGIVHLRCRVILKQLTYYGLFRISRRCNSYKWALLIASPNRYALNLLLPRKHQPRFLTKTKLKRKVDNVPDLHCNCKLPLALFRSTGLIATPRQRRQKMHRSYSYSEFYSQAYELRLSSIVILWESTGHLHREWSKLLILRSYSPKTKCVI